jgi:hypothetical protein
LPLGLCRFDSFQALDVFLGDHRLVELLEQLPDVIQHGLWLSNRRQ